MVLLEFSIAPAGKGVSVSPFGGPLVFSAISGGWKTSTGVAGFQQVNDLIGFSVNYFSSILWRQTVTNIPKSHKYRPQMAVGVWIALCRRANPCGNGFINRGKRP